MPSAKRKNAVRESSVALATVAQAGTAAALAGSDPLVVAAASVLAMLPQAVGLAIPALFRRKRTAVERWWRSVLAAIDGQNGTQLRSEIENRIAEGSEAAQTVVESLRTVLDAVDDAVVPILGDLTADYLRRGAPPDPFFRGFSRLLCSLHANDLPELVQLVRGLDAWTGDDDPLAVHAFPETGGSRSIRVARGNTGWDPVAELRRPLPLFRGLKANELADEATAGPFGAASGPDFLEIERTVVRHLARLLVDRTAPEP